MDNTMKFKVGQSVWFTTGTPGFFLRAIIVSIDEDTKYVWGLVGGIAEIGVPMEDVREGLRE